MKEEVADRSSFFTLGENPEPMRSFLFIILCLFCFSTSRAQKLQNVYFLKFNGQEVKLKDSADFIRIIQEPDSGSTYFKVLEYFPDNTRRFIGEVSSFEPQLVYEGLSIRYYKNGGKESNIKFRKGIPEGTAYYFYPNGKVKKELLYGESGMKVNRGYDHSYYYKVQSYFDSSGVKRVTDGSGHVIERGPSFIEDGDYINGMREGNWRFTSIKKGTISEETYAAGIFVSGKVTKPDGSSNTYQSAEALPEYQGGIKSFYNYLSNNIQYPPDARMARIAGTVYVALVVETDGKVTDPKVIKSVHPSLDKEALRVIRRSPKWIPGHQHGVPVKAAYTVPVAYKLRL